MRRATLQHSAMSSLESCCVLLLKTATTATGECAMVLPYELQCAAAYAGYKREQGCVGNRLLLPPSELSTKDSEESDAVCDDVLLSSSLLGEMRYRGMVVDQLTAR